jgi:uncharacterized protein (DUF2147 family)
MKKLFTALFVIAACNPLIGWSQDDSPVGLWKNIDDHSGKPRALIRIVEQGNELNGRIEKLFLEPGEDQHPKCDKCEGVLKDQPTLGMTILTGFTRIDAEYKNGMILDPENGKLYKSKMSLSEDGKKLTVRGYIGIPLFGRSQTWVREQ